MEKFEYAVVNMKSGITEIRVSSEPISFFPLSETMVSDATLEVVDGALTITGNEHICDMFFERSYDTEEIEKYVEKDVKRSCIMKSPYLKGWCERKERKPYKFVTNTYSIQYL